MSIQKFTAPTSREALAKARHAFGEATLILSNRSTALGVEVMATSDDHLRDLGVVNHQAATATARSVEDDADQLAMSTLSFQDYVRERMLRRRHEANNPRPSPALSQPLADRAPQADTAAPTKPTVAPTAPAPGSAPSPALKSEALKAQITSPIMDELRSVKSLIEERFNTMSWLGQVQRQPVQSGNMLRLLKAGFSSSLARALVEKMPPELNATEAMDWAHQILERNLKASPPEHLIQQGGVFALVGATGVGKTTTSAKLAAQGVALHGPQSVGLITLDLEKGGAHEQLRQHGRMMGVVAHMAHDRAALADLLQLLANKKLVVIDTAGLSPKDPRREDVLAMLDLDQIKRVLVLQASSQVDAMEDTVKAFRQDPALPTILSKTDEAVKLAPALDVVIRHQLLLQGLTNGQRVPEDWSEVDKPALVRRALQSPQASAFDFQLDDLSYLFSPSTSANSAARMH